jgi:hypothetical protein
MKRKFFNCAKRHSVVIEDYLSFRSDMGCQAFDLNVIMPNGNKTSFQNEYFVGEKDGGIRMLNLFESFLKSNL